MCIIKSLTLASMHDVRPCLQSCEYQWIQNRIGIGVWKWCVGYIYIYIYVCMYIYILIWVFPKIMVPQNHPFVHRVWNHYKPSILGHPIFGNTHIYVYIEREREVLYVQEYYVGSIFNIMCHCFWCPASSLDSPAICTATAVWSKLPLLYFHSGESQSLLLREKMPNEQKSKKHQHNMQCHLPWRKESSPRPICQPKKGKISRRLADYQPFRLGYSFSHNHEVENNHFGD